MNEFVNVEKVYNDQNKRELSLRKTFWNSLSPLCDSIGIERSDDVHIGEYTKLKFKIIDNNNRWNPEFLGVEIVAEPDYTLRNIRAVRRKLIVKNGLLSIPQFREKYNEVLGYAKKFEQDAVRERARREQSDIISKERSANEAIAKERIVDIKHFVKIKGSSNAEVESGKDIATYTIELHSLTEEKLRKIIHIYEQ